MSEHAIIIYIPLSGSHISKEEKDAIFALEDELEKAITNAQYGELDGDEFGSKEAVIYMYAPDADKLHEIINPVLDFTIFVKGTRVVTRYGDADDENAREVETVIS
jgi:hypothetical protein